MRRRLSGQPFFFRLLCNWIIINFLISAIVPASLFAQPLDLPAPGSMLMTSPTFTPVSLKGLKVDTVNPLLFDFIIENGESGPKIDSDTFKAETQKLIKYFLAALTIKEENLWVNLSPYEKDRMIPAELGQTELGRDMLAQDYVLKQLTASLIYPEKDLGKKFWNKIYAKALEQFGTTDIPIDTFNKVWIVADQAEVLERNNAAYVVAAHLKVMLETDYLANRPGAINGAPAPESSPASDLTQSILREIIVPEIEKEVNTGRNFSTLRQMFDSMILATWYKLALKDALLNQVYSNKGKISGVLADDPTVTQKIYNQYLQAFQKGVFNYIKDAPDTGNQDFIPRKYFSGGVNAAQLAKTIRRVDYAANALALPDNALQATLIRTEIAKQQQFYMPPAPIPPLTSRIPPHRHIYTGQMSQTDSPTAINKLPRGAILIGPNLKPNTDLTTISVGLPPQAIRKMLTGKISNDFPILPSGATIVVMADAIIERPDKREILSDLPAIVADSLFDLLRSPAVAEFMHQAREAGNTLATSTKPIIPRYEQFLAPYANKLTPTHIQQLASSLHVSPEFLETIEIVKDSLQLRTIEIEITGESILGNILDAFLSRTIIKQQLRTHGITIAAVKAVRAKITDPSLTISLPPHRIINFMITHQSTINLSDDDANPLTPENIVFSLQVNTEDHSIHLISNNKTLTTEQAGTQFEIYSVRNSGVHYRHLLLKITFDNGTLRLFHPSETANSPVDLRVTYPSLLRTRSSADHGQLSTASRNGGIDLNAKNMNLAVNKTGSNIPMTIDPAMLAEFEKGDFNGVEGIILQMAPLENPWAFMGFEPEPLRTPGKL